MAGTAGFACVGCFSENLTNAVLRAYHANFVPPLQGALPSLVTVGATSVSLEGSVILLAPQVTLRTRADDLVTVRLGFAGQVVFTAGADTAQVEVVLETTLLVGLLTAVKTAGGKQQITVGLNLSSAAVTAVDVAVMVGPPLSPLFSASLGAPAVLTVLTALVRSIPPSLVQLTPSGLTLPVTLSQTYEPPPKASLFSFDTLFQVQLSLKRIVARPVDSFAHHTGNLVIGIDLATPVGTAGNPAALVDLNTAPAPRGNVVEYGRDGDGRDFGATFAGGAIVHHNSDFAFAFDGGTLSSIVNNAISPQLAGKFPTKLAEKQVAFSPVPDCVSLQFGTFNPPLDSPWSPPISTLDNVDGVILKLKLTKFAQVTRNADGYYVGIAGEPGNLGFVGNIDVGVTIDSCALLQVFDRETPRPPRPPSGAKLRNIAFTTNPAGGYIYVDGGVVDVGLGPWAIKTLQLPMGPHALAADPSTFQSWSTSGSAKIDNPSSAAATLTINGDGAVSLQQASSDPYLSQDFWSVALIGVDIQLPWWVEPLAILLGPLYIVAASFADLLFGVDIWYPTIIGNLENSALSKLQNAISGAISGTLFLNHPMNVVQLPATTAPNWLVSKSDIVFSPDGLAAYVKSNLLPPGLILGSTGAFPYLMITDQDLTDLSTVPDIPDPDGGFPLRFDGTFNWPGISFNAPGSGIPEGNVTWDVHRLNPIGAVLKVPPGLFNPQDPSVYVEWEVRRTDTNAVIAAKTLGLGQAGAPLNIFALSIDHASAELQAADGFRISCRLFRPLATSTEEIFSTKVTVTVTDHFDRHHPYVHWGPSVKFVYSGEPFWAAIPRGKHLPGQRWVKNVRRSRIHRTDYWNGGRRCMVADAPGSMGKMPRSLRGKVNRPAPGTPRFGPGNYLDRLPISLSAVRENRELARGILCDYCFFGGRTSTDVRDDFP